ncbi:MAG TPA: polyprenyl synthetase family protein [Syntrophaceticus sp.]|nr:polyprenyl synthetase family protein [Syntrophaceticus sp.]
MDTAVLDQTVEINLLPLLGRVEQRLYEVAVAPNKIGELVSYIIKAGGKRLRPLLVLLSAWREDIDWEPVIDVAAAAELLHTASLIHDDIIDRAETRRGLPTISKLYGNHIAVLAGDYLFARAITLLSKNNTSCALPLMAESIQSMCEGIIEEAASLFDYRVNEKDYLSRIYKKTASLVAACCGSGALVSGASQEKVATMMDYGRYLGLSYQIVDDILDFISDDETLGKPTGSDLSQGILTLPVIYLLEHPHCRNRVKEILAKHSCTAADIDYIRNAAFQNAAISRAYSKARGFQEKARKCLYSLALTPVHKLFDNITYMVINRSH